MKVEVNKIPTEGLRLAENIDPALLDLDTDIVKFSGLVRIEAEILRITNAVTAEITLSGTMRADCSRCLNEVKFDLHKVLRLSFPAEKYQPVIDLNPDIREEIILDYPLKPLCKDNCKGLCPKCGRDLNQGDCNCGST